MNLNILHLYPKEMNLYGDHGNILTLRKRCEWRGIKTKVYTHEPGQEIPNDIDIIFGGGGQDSGQSKIEKDLVRIAPELKEMIEAGTPTLVICGLYQLFGEYFETSEGQKIQGTNILGITTKGGPTRLIGNITINTPELGEVVGYENHSGLTTLKPGTLAFGTVVNGAPILPKNPRVADFLILKALEKKTGKAQKLAVLNDRIEQRAHKVAISRPR